MQTPTLNGLYMASQCMQETTCKFQPSLNMYNLMTTSNLYGHLNMNNSDDDDEIIFEI